MERGPEQQLAMVTHPFLLENQISPDKNMNRTPKKINKIVMKRAPLKIRKDLMLNEKPSNKIKY